MKKAEQFWLMILYAAMKYIEIFVVVEIFHNREAKYFDRTNNALDNKVLPSRKNSKLLRISGFQLLCVQASKEHVDRRFHHFAQFSW